MAYDFTGVAAAALRDAHQLVPRWLPGGRPESNEWVAANPQRPGSDGGGAFRINLHTGEWADFAGTAKGGDLISLLAYLRGIKNGEACKMLAAELGIESGAARAWKPQVVGGRATKSEARPLVDDFGEQLVPAPAAAPPYQGAAVHAKLGAATRCWPYRDANGQLLMVVARFEEPERGAGEKSFLPMTVWRRPSGVLSWRFKGIPSGQRPLYRLDDLAARPAATVIVCEGEKAADHAAALLPEFVATTSPHGSRSAGTCVWSPLAGRRVVIWPDHDAAGLVYAADVLRLLRLAGVGSVQCVSFAWVAAIKANAAARGAA